MYGHHQCKKMPGKLMFINIGSQNHTYSDINQTFNQKEIKIVRKYRHHKYWESDGMYLMKTRTKILVVWWLRHQTTKVPRNKVSFFIFCAFFLRRGSSASMK